MFLHCFKLGLHDLTGQCAVQLPPATLVQARFQRKRHWHSGRSIADIIEASYGKFLDGSKKGSNS